jgi:signal transduction histidine kinase
MFKLDQFVAMQFAVVFLLAIISYQSARAFRAEAFRWVAWGWGANFAYLVITLPTIGQSGLLGLSPNHIGALAGFCDFLANTIFWYAAHRWGQTNKAIYLPKLKQYFLAVPALLYLVATVLVHVISRPTYLGFLAFTLPTVLLDTMAIMSLAYYFREVATQYEGLSPSRARVLYIGTMLYAGIQSVQLFAYKALESRAEQAGFILGLTAKVLIFLGIIRLLVISTQTLSSTLAEQNAIRELVRAMDRLGHEIGTPIGEIQLSVKGLLKGRGPGDASLLRSIESAASRATAILQASMFAIDPAAPRPVSRRTGEKWMSEELARKQVMSVNTMIEIAEAAVKSTRNEKVLYDHQYSGSCCISCVPNEIVQVFINIFRNAYDAMAAVKTQGRINITTLNDKVLLSGTVEFSKGTAKIIVRDNGEGIDINVRPKMFMEGVSTRGNKGRGFGLAIIKRFVENNGGAVEINSPPKIGLGADMQGTEVILTFPRVACRQ